MAEPLNLFILPSKTLHPLTNISLLGSPATPTLLSVKPLCFGPICDHSNPKSCPSWMSTTDSLPAFWMLLQRAAPGASPSVCCSWPCQGQCPAHPVHTHRTVVEGSLHPATTPGSVGHAAWSTDGVGPTVLGSSGCANRTP